MNPNLTSRIILTAIEHRKINATISNPWPGHLER